MRILVTNDDGVSAPGIAALARAAQRTGNDVVIVAPLVDWSGASAAVGAFYSRGGVQYETFELDGLQRIPTYGVDGPPALGVILACVGGFGARPDLVLSGINHGVNVGRAALHSGTIGAVLTASQFGISGLATSIRYGPDPVPWDTAAHLAERLVPVLGSAPASTVLSLNVPDVLAQNLNGVRAASLGRGGTIRRVSHVDSAYESEHDGIRQEMQGESRSPDTAPHTPRHTHLPPGPRGTLHLELAIPGTAGEDAPTEGVDDRIDTVLIRKNFATITPLLGVGEAPGAGGVMDAALEALTRIS